ncbi:hypothetical protein ACMFMF_004094 [Clarireedia jacksonii]
MTIDRSIPTIRMISSLGRATSSYADAAKDYYTYIERLRRLAPQAVSNYQKKSPKGDAVQRHTPQFVDSHSVDSIKNSVESVKESPVDASNETNKLHTVMIKNMPFSSIFLRDACTCEQCVDPSTKQKNFQTSDIPPEIKAVIIKDNPNQDVFASWENDLPGFGPNHRSKYSNNFFWTRSNKKPATEQYPNEYTRLWNSAIITNELQYVTYDDYVNTEEGLFRALRMLSRHGLLLLRHVPDSESSVITIAERIGNLRDTFYGRTWDVKSVPQAKNVAYTAQYLGLHMDLLYMANPPGFQFLHCLKNTCSGGSSIFSDAFHAVSKLDERTVRLMKEIKIAYHYRNAGEHYYYEHPLIRRRMGPAKWAKNGLNVAHVNYSPPFQAPFRETGVLSSAKQTASIVKCLREFAAVAEAPDSLYEYKLQEGECVIFNNRRVLHGRKEFDTTAGERWFKGAYVDTDAFMSRLRVFSERFKDEDVTFLENHARYIKWDIEDPETGRRETDPLRVWSRSRDLPQAEEYAQML